jgi:excisionase family DNA binding protein
VTRTFEIADEMVPHLALAVAYYRREILPRDGMPTPPELVEVQEWATKAARHGQARPTLAGAAATSDDRLVSLLLMQSEVADMLRSSTRTVRRLTAAGKLRAVSLEGSTRYRRSDVEEYVASLGPRPFRERVSTKASSAWGAEGAAGRAVTAGTTTSPSGTEHRKGAA